MSEKRFLEILAASPAAVWLVHAVLLRVGRAFGRALSPIGSTFVSLALGLPVVGWAVLPFLARQSGPARTCAAVYALIVYCCGAYFYFHMFTLSETSRRLRILTTLYREGPMSLADLEKHYPPLAQIDRRLERLAGMGQVEERGGRYYLKSRLLWLVARAVEAWRGFL